MPPKIHWIHDDVIKWKHFPRYWPFVRGIHRSPVNSPHKGQWHRALMFAFICARINGWINNRQAGDLRRHRPHYDVTVMLCHRNVAWSVIPRWWIKTFQKICTRCCFDLVVLPVLSGSWFMYSYLSGLRHWQYDSRIIFLASVLWSRR